MGEVLPLPDAATEDALVAWMRRIRVNEQEINMATDLLEWIRETPVTDVEAVARHAGLSLRGLQRLFRRHVGAP